MICQYGYSPFPPLRASGEGFGVGGGGFAICYSVFPSYIGCYFELSC